MAKIQLPPYLKDDRADCALVLASPDSNFADLKREFTRFDRLYQGYGGLEGLKRYVQAYLACVAFVDDQLGIILNALEKSPYADNTIVVFTSDHGFHLGEKDWLMKQTVWEESTRIPLVIRAPGVSKAGGACPQPVSLIDLYPTLVDLCRLPANPNANGNGKKLDGYSLLPLLLNPQQGKWQGPTAALSVIYENKPLQTNTPGPVQDQHFTIRSNQFRYSLCNNGEEELYDHRQDLNEWKNLAKAAEYRNIKARLRNQLLQMTGRETQVGP